MKKLKQSIIKFLNEKPPAATLFEELIETGNLVLIGGVLREYIDNECINSLRDIDIVIEIKNYKVWNDIINKYSPCKNKFSGYKFVCSGFIFDVWPIEETWAFKNNIIKYNETETLVSKLQDTVFLNMDAIVFDFTTGIWYKERYEEAIKNGTIDVVLEENPQIPLNIVRLFVIKNRYNMNVSETLKKIIRDTIKKYTDLDSFIDDLINIQENRYHTVHLSRELLRKEIKNII